MKQNTSTTRISFAEIGGATEPWFILSFLNEIHIYSYYREYKSYLDKDGHLILNVFRDGSWKHDSHRSFDRNSREGILQAVRLCFLLTQEPLAETGKRKIAEKSKIDEIVAGYR